MFFRILTAILCTLKQSDNKTEWIAWKKLYRVRDQDEESDRSAVFAVLSISFEVDIPTGKGGGSLFFECRRRELPREVWRHAPPEKFEIQMLGNAIFNVFQTVFGPKR